MTLVDVFTSQPHSTIDAMTRVTLLNLVIVLESGQNTSSVFHAVQDAVATEAPHLILTYIISIYPSL